MIVIKNIELTYFLLSNYPTHVISYKNYRWTISSNNNLGFSSPKTFGQCYDWNFNIKTGKNMLNDKEIILLKSIISRFNFEVRREDH